MVDINQTRYFIKQAWFSLLAKPGFMITVVTTLGLSLGALLSVLTLAYLLLVEPLPYPQQEQLYTIEHQLVDNNQHVDGQAFTYPNLMYLFNKQTAFSESAMMYYDADVLLTSATQPTLSVAFVTPSWFSLLGTKMALGRAFEQTEALDTYQPVAVISYETWQQQFAQRDDILSKSMQFGERSYRIIGVLSEDFIEPQMIEVGLKSQVFLPWDFNSVSAEERHKWGNDDSSMMFLGKLSNNNSANQVEQSLSDLVSENWQHEVTGYGFFKGWSIRLKLHSLQSVILAKSETTLYLLIAGVVGLVLIAGANIANLFISRTAERHRNLAICAALGATHQQLFRSLLIEALLIMGLASFFAIYVASLGFILMQHSLSSYLPRVDELTIHPITLGIALILLIAMALLFAILSKSLINYQALNQSLQNSGKGLGIQVSKKMRQGLIFCQIAVVSLLVFTNLVLLTQALYMITEPMGFTTDNTSFVVISVPNREKADDAILGATMRELRTKLAALPQVTDISQSMAPMPFFTQALSRYGGDERFSIKAKDVDHRYFQLIGQPLLQGGFFSAADIEDNNKVMIVNDVFAHQLTPNGDVIGMIFDNGVKVVGVVKGIKVPGEQDIPARFYFPASTSRNMFLVKTKEGQSLGREQIIQAIKSVDSSYSLFSLSTLDARRNERLLSQYTTAITSGVLALVSFLLAAIGLYGILSYATQMRRFEIGTRMALGAKRKQLIALVVKENAQVISLGIIASILFLVMFYSGYSQELDNFIGFELVYMFALTTIFIFLLALFACYWPLRKYINQPAIHALRSSE
jgi:predicted permease